MIRKNLFVTAALILLSFSAMAQKMDTGGDKSAQAFYVEGGGAGIFTINYDQRLKGSTGLGFRAGMGGYGFLKKGVFTVPVGLNYLTGADGHYAEIGAGLCYVSLSQGNTYFDNTGSLIVGYFNFGYRYQPVKRGLTYRIFLSPLLTAAGTVPFYGGASVGVKF